MYAKFRNVLFFRVRIRSEHTQLLSRLKISVPTHTPIRLFMRVLHPFLPSTSSDDSLSKNRKKPSFQQSLLLGSYYAGCGVVLFFSSSSDDEQDNDNACDAANHAYDDEEVLVQESVIHREYYRVAVCRVS